MTNLELIREAKKNVQVLEEIFIHEKINNILDSEKTDDLLINTTNLLISIGLKINE